MDSEVRLEVLCEDRLGLTRELLDILATKEIDLRGIEIDRRGIIYLNCPEIEFDDFRDLMAQIRLISGVTDVRKIQFMPSERQSTELMALLANLPDPVLSVSLKGTIDVANHSARDLFFHQGVELIDEPINHYIPQFNFARWLEESSARFRDNVVINGLDYTLEVMPVYITGEANDTVLASAVVTLKNRQQNVQSDPFLSESNNLGFEHFVGSSNRHKNLMAQAKKLATMSQPLLIEGETGTGKEMLARACHNRSERASNPFLVLSCASMPDDVAETELFGHAPGTFNNQAGHIGIFEQANGGTVFLDEIGEMSAHLQIKFLRFLQDGTFRRVGEENEVHVDVRVIAATKQKLSDLTETGVFREDLYYRLNVLSLHIPALRERNSDVATLLDLFVSKYAHQLGMNKPSISDEALEQLTQYPWPGNIRQLDNMVLRAMTRLNGETLQTEDFELPTIEQSNALVGVNLDGSLDEIMKSYESQILQSLYQSFPSSRKLAKRLNVSHTSIANKLRDYGIRKS
ncbi:Transcriptional regulatory protein tyrR [Vibrio nigripulchritudo SOn1]|uniref:HTH-type transcriptional regulatory protein TyrR n=1 Tax=Vibrio nigripulchritudo SOn1 TaxID=1238450 RepID=A0AAV2VVB8_9VIBR|nr:Transcriptional regulatory protein tyrR [Vibrio nigripulchritudo SOn1]